MGQWILKCFWNEIPHVNRLSHQTPVPTWLGNPDIPLETHKVSSSVMSWKPNPLAKFKFTDLGALKAGFNWICSSPGPDWIKHFHDLFQPQGIFGDRTGVDFIQWIISFPVTWTGTLKPHFGYTNRSICCDPRDHPPGKSCVEYLDAKPWDEREVQRPQRWIFIWKWKNFVYKHIQNA